jgi:FkbM family methyltransferase
VTAPVLHGVTWDGKGLFSSALLFYCRKVPDHPGKLRLARTLGQFLFQSELPVMNKNLGVALTIDIKDYVGHAIVFSGGYEPASVARAVEIMRGGGLFVDVGANFGLYTVSVASLPGVRCLGIDPSYIALSRLNKNIALNGLANVELVNAALSGQAGLVHLTTPDDSNLGTTRINTSLQQSSCSRFWAGALTLQSVLEASTTSGIQLLKIDVEGHEYQVLQGLDWRGQYRPNNIILEFDPVAFNEATNAMSYLREQGYVPYTVNGVPLDNNVTTPPEHNLWFRDSGGME